MFENPAIGVFQEVVCPDGYTIRRAVGTGVKWGRPVMLVPWRLQNNARVYQHACELHMDAMGTDFTAHFMGVGARGEQKILHTIRNNDPQALVDAACAYYRLVIEPTIKG